MSAKRIVLWRHGQTDYNVNGQVQGQVDVDLNAAGVEQAVQAALILKESEPSIIVSSDLGRARQTAQELAGRAGVDVTLDKRLRERAFGVFEGLTAQQMNRDFAEEFDMWRKTGESPAAGVETRENVGRRVSECFKEYAEHAPEGSTVVFVSHGSALTQGLVALLELDPLQWQGMRGLDNCHWSVLVPHNRSPHWRLAAHNLGAGFSGFSSVLPGALGR